MEFIFFFYGLAFFLMGFAVLVYPKKDSSFFLAHKIHWVAWFGIIHGLNEWLDMFIMVRAMELTVFLEFFRMMTLPLSFLCLVYFGAEVISSQNSKCRFCKFITPVLLVIWAGVFFLGVHSGLRWDIWSRYLLCFTGSTLTGIALWMHVSEIETTENTKLAFYLKAAGAAFVFYGVLAGLIVPDADFFPSSVLNYSLFSSGLEIPIQVFRSLCAVVIAYYLIRVLKIFQWETRQTLYNSELRFKTVVDTAPVILFMTDTEQKISFFEGKSVESLGIRAADVLGRSVAEVFSHIPQVSESTQKALAGEKITSTVPIGDSYFEVFLAPFRSRRGKIQGMTGVAVDVTQQKAAQAQMDKYRYDMEKNKALAAIGSLSTEIAKDMIDPLHESKVSLLKASSGLRNTIGAEEVKMNIKNGVEGLSRAIKKLDGFCDKANLEKSIQSQPIEIYEITQRILSVFQETIQHAMVRISIERADFLPVMNISSRELEQIFYTMIQNVIRSADGTHLHHLDIDFSIHDEFFYMKFSEYCPKDSAENIEKRPDDRITAFPDRDKYNFELSVLKGITEAYGGAVTITPNSQGGYVYEIRIPVVD
ncbi:MAG: PAS domain-containing protein [Planctomycetota bacterium]|jgi:PAS domain S-box-containing protein